MAYPVVAVTRPAVLSGQSNGRLDPSILVATPGQAGGQAVNLVRPAARAWRALASAALAAGHVLKPTSLYDSYRPYSVQERIFRDRYQTDYLPNRPYKIWNGVRWYQRAGTAIAAVPGTSNHGWALAVDTGEERDSDAGTESLDSPTLNWLLANEGAYGFSHEVQSEPWHIRYFAGDRIPQAVLDYEKGAPQVQEDDNMGKQMIMASTEGPSAGAWWITDGKTKRWIRSVEHASFLAFVGFAEWNNGGPFLIAWEHQLGPIPVDISEEHTPSNFTSIIEEIRKVPGWVDATFDESRIASEVAAKVTLPPPEPITDIDAFAARLAAQLAENPALQPALTEEDIPAVAAAVVLAQGKALVNG